MGHRLGGRVSHRKFELHVNSLGPLCNVFVKHLNPPLSLFVAFFVLQNCPCEFLFRLFFSSPSVRGCSRDAFTCKADLVFNHLLHFHFAPHTYTALSKSDIHHISSKWLKTALMSYLFNFIQCVVLSILTAVY